MRKTKVVVVLGTFLLLAGCSHLKLGTLTKVETVPVVYPENLIDCPLRIEDVDPETATQKDVAEWAARIDNAHARCRVTIEGLRLFNDRETKRLEKSFDNED